MIDFIYFRVHDYRNWYDCMNDFSEIEISVNECMIIIEARTR